MFELLFFIENMLFFAIPIGSIALFGISLYRYISAKKQNKVAQGTFSDGEIEKRKIMLIEMSVIVGVLVAIVIGVIILLHRSVAYM